MKLMRPERTLNNCQIIWKEKTLLPSSHFGSRWTKIFQGQVRCNTSHSKLRVTESPEAAHDCEKKSVECDHLSLSLNWTHIGKTQNWLYCFHKPQAQFLLSNERICLPRPVSSQTGCCQCLSYTFPTPHWHVDYEKLWRSKCNLLLLPTAVGQRTEYFVVLVRLTIVTNTGW